MPKNIIHTDTQVCAHATIQIQHEHKGDTNRCTKRYSQMKQICNTPHHLKIKIKHHPAPPPPLLLSSSFLFFLLQMRADTPLCPDLACFSNFSRLRKQPSSSLSCASLLLSCLSNCSFAFTTATLLP